MDKKRNFNTIFGYGVFAIMLVTILILRFTYGSVVAVTGTSMYPTFNSGDFVFGTVVKDDTDISHGDIVVVEQDDKLLIKRVYGLPGEQIMPDYVKNIPEQTLQNNEYYVVGDNWKNSRDSRTFGPVTRDNIVFKYADIHWTRTTLIISLLLPVVLFIAQMTIVFIPADRKPKANGSDDKNQEKETCDDDKTNVTDNQKNVACDIIEHTQNDTTPTEVSAELNIDAPSEHPS